MIFLAQSDGSIVISAEIDDSKAQAELNRLTKRIDALKDKINDKKQEQLPLVEQARQLGAQLDAAKLKLEQLRSAGSGASPDALHTQEETVRALQSQFDGVNRRVESLGRAIDSDTARLEHTETRAGELSGQLAGAGRGTEAMAHASERAAEHLDKFNSHIKTLARRIFVFSIITRALQNMKEYMSNVILSNAQASASIARLKAAFLTLVQPLIDKLIPAITNFVDLVTGAITTLARFTSKLFGTTFDDSKKAAENLYDEADALDKTGDAAKKAGKSLASFDEINQLGANSDDSSIKLDFAGLDGAMGGLTEKVAQALLIAGIALVVIGASTCSLTTVLAGLALLGTALVIKGDDGKLQSWVDALGLESVEEFVGLALILGGIALVAIGAAMGNLILVLAGMGLIGAAIYYAKQSGMMDDWAKKLNLSKAAAYITAALLIGGFALIAIGAATGKILMVIAGIGLIAAGIYIGKESGTLEKWAKVLGLDSVFDYVMAGLTLAGIALIALGAIRGSKLMVITGAIMLGAGILADIIGEEKLKSWWEVLKLTSVKQWVSVALLLAGIVMVAIAAFTGNIGLLVAGLVLLAVGVAVGTEGGGLKDWVKTLGLEKVMKWVTAAVMLAGIAMVVIGIVTANVLMFIAGIGLIAVGIVIGKESGTFDDWVKTLGLEKVKKWVPTALILAGVALIAIGAMLLNPLMIIAGIALAGGGAYLQYKNLTAKSNSVSASSGTFGGTASAQTALPSAPIPKLASGAVIPPNREFLAVLGDQRQGRNIEAPESAIEAAVARGMARAGGGNQTVVLQIGEQEFGRLVYRLNNQQVQRVGVKLGGNV